MSDRNNFKNRPSSEYRRPVNGGQRRETYGVQQPYRGAGQDGRRSVQPERRGASPNGGRPQNYGAKSSSGGYSRPQAGNAAQRQNVRPENRVQRPAQPKRSAGKSKKSGNVALKILKGIVIVIVGIFSTVGMLFSKLNRKLDVFRKNETSTVIVNALVGGVVVVILLCIFLLCKPGIDASRAASLAARGKTDAAMRLVNGLEAKDYPEEKLSKVRVSVIKGFTKSGKFEKASSLLAEMPESDVQKELIMGNSYAKALSLYDAGEYTEAAQMFYQITDYQDSALKYADCCCALAIEAHINGNDGTARSLLLDVPDIVERVSNAAMKVTGSAEEAAKVLSAPLFQEANLIDMAQTMQEINAARSEMPNGKIAAGEKHTVALRSGGTLMGTGDNSRGQLNVGEWTGITQLAAGAYHTVGLRADGSVLAAGDNSVGQCDVSGWTDIVAIAAGAYDTIGIKSDGTVVACGKNSAKVSGWHNVSAIDGGSYSLGCLYDNGAMLSSHKTAQMEMGAVLYDLSVWGQVSVGVLYDGTLVSSFDSAPAWTGMVSATACENGILGIDADGQVKTFFYRPGDYVEISVPGEAVEIESGGTHYVVLTSDGRVYAFGNNDYGQCGVNGWQL